MRAALLLLGLLINATCAATPATCAADFSDRPVIHYSGPLTISPWRVAATDQPSSNLDHYTYSQSVLFVDWGWGYGGFGGGGWGWGW